MVHTYWFIPHIPTVADAGLSMKPLARNSMCISCTGRRDPQLHPSSQILCEVCISRKLGLNSSTVMKHLGIPAGILNYHGLARLIYTALSGSEPL